MSGAQSTGVRWGAEVILNEVKSLDAVSQELSTWLDSVPRGHLASRATFLYY